VARIDRVDATCPRIEKDTGEAPSSSAHVQGDPVMHTDLERAQSRTQLGFATERLLLSDGDRSFADKRRRIRDDAPADKDESLSDDFRWVADFGMSPHKFVAELAQAWTALAAQDFLLWDA
jgi:hypothetical protein